uniref:Uncharacterized protein n=1 Tax=termite gut metagenome TaxID=433724 RepID=S0DF87_9ZZZZ
MEDAGIGEQDLRERFGDRVTELVRAQSEDKSKSWDERKAHTIELLAQTNDEDIKIVALGDKLANTRSLFVDYRAQGDALWRRFNVTDPAKHC